MPTILSTMRDDGDNYNSNNNIPAPATSADHYVFESSYDSDYSSNSGSRIAEYEETAEDIEATSFLNELLKNQSRKDGDFKRIESMLVKIITINYNSCYLS